MHVAGLRAVAATALLAASWCAPGSARAQAPWARQSPLPTSSDLRGVSMVSTTEGWAVGSAGEILHTTDGGVSWTSQASGTTDPFNAVFFLDPLHGWAVGSRVARTTDGGRTWLLTGTVGTMYGVDFVDTRRGWAVGNGAVAYWTTDGGATWSFVGTGGSWSLVDVDFVDASTGWAVGGGGQIYRSSDGGRSWTPQASNTNAWLDGVCFIGPLEGFAAGWGQLLHTTDGGATWSTVSNTPGVNLADVTFVDAQNGWAVGDTQKVLRTTDGGVTWSMQLLGDTGYLESVSMVDALHGVIVGARGHLFSTDDGGVTWVSRRNGSVSGTRDFDAVDSQTVWAANEGEVLFTTDGGARWSMLGRSLFAGSPYGIDFFDRARGWMVNAGTRTHRTTDGGASWIGTRVTTESNVTLNDIAVADDRTVVVVGGEGVFLNSRIYRSTDGGVTWRARPHPTLNWTYYAVDFADASTGYAVGNLGGILRTNDGGDTWFTVRSSSPVQLVDVSFADASHGWAVGPAGYVVHTADGGATWQEQNLPGLAGWENIVSVSAVSATTAWVSGTNRLLSRTTDGGATWENEDTSSFPGQGSFPAIAFLDAENGWACYSTGYPFGQIHRRTRSIAPPASFTVFGAGCAGSAGPPALAASPASLPQSGSTFTVKVTALPPGQPVFGLLGGSRTVWGAFSLPLELAVVGMPSCSLLVSIDVALGLANAGGEATWSLPIPGGAALLGLSFYQQAFVADPGVNALGATVSNGGCATVGQ